MLQRIRNSKATRFISVLLALELIISLLPTSAMALSTGPSQPEVQSFEPIATTDMVDPFSGDFNYNIPLMQVGNYPINIFYHAGAGMDEEASATGLGWNINPGNITRNMRGLPDDFMGDEIITEQNIKANNTYKLNFGVAPELFGIEGTDLGISGNMSLYYNNYKGIGYSFGGGLALGGVSTNLGFDSQSGFDANLSLQATLDESPTRTPGITKSKKLGASIGFNSRAGLGQLTLSYSQQTNDKRAYSTTKNKDAKDDKRAGNQRGKSNSTYARGSISFASKTYTPAFTPGMYNTNVSLGVQLGPTFTGASVGFTIGGTFSTNYLKFKDATHKAMGYLYTGSTPNVSFAKGKDEDQGFLMDFNRDRDPQMTKKTKWLHTVNYSYDMFSVAGQGTGGMFRPFRNNIGQVYDPLTKVNNWSETDVTLELGVGNLVKAGADIRLGCYTGSIEPWSDWWDENEATGSTSLAGALNFNREDYHDDPLAEAAYFKMVGEHTASDNDYFSLIGNEKALMIPLDYTPSGSFISADLKKVKRQFKDNNGTTYAPSSTNNKYERAIRDKRNQSISYLTAEEATRYGLEKTIKSYNNDNSITSIPRYTPNTNGTRKKHHLSEIIVTNADGTRYVYGIAAYNTEQTEYSFSVDKPSGNPQNVDYETQDITKGNSKGIDHYYKKVKTPGYAHSFLLTAVLSPDYIDVTGNGPSEDDLGTYTKINYQLVYTDYGWRTPFTKDVASYNRGLMSDKTDDKASIVYGKKEIWYVHSIESKTQIAKFTYSARNDSYGSAGVDGGMDSNKPLYKTDKISLYSKTEVNKHSGDYDATNPIKVAHFTYNYSLCPNVPNNIYANYKKNDGTTDYIDNSGAHNIAGGRDIQSGKLTLTDLYFTYGNNSSGQSSKYFFNYGGYDPDAGDPDANEVNPEYCDKKSDRWGTYKEEETVGSGTLNPWEHPYTKQDADIANTNAKVWNMTKIKLPSGGIINVDYESDQYKYMQDKIAMRMVKIAGFTHDITTAGTNTPYYTDGLEIKQNKYVVVELPEEITDQAMLDEYLGSINKLYFTFKTNLLTNPLNTPAEPEIITGFADVDKSGAAYGMINNDFTSNNLAWIKVKLIDDGGRDVNPFSIAAWQFMRNNRPDIAYPGSAPLADGLGVQDVFDMLFGTITQIGAMITGMRTYCLTTGKAKNVDLNQSFVRVNCRETGENAGKLGGGHRVKSIQFVDNWNEMSGEDHDAIYGQEYDYVLSNGTTSGVAAYEPTIGGDESPLHLPLFDTYNNPPLGPDDRFYVEGPIGEQFYPSASVGYSRVVVRNRKPKSSDSNTNMPGSSSIKRHGSGRTIYEFYTARDYPVKIEVTPIETKHAPGFSLANLLSPVKLDGISASQGFTIVTNDMHGKQRATGMYAETETENDVSDLGMISKTEYFYDEDNVVMTVDRNGNIASSNIAKDIDMVVETKHKQDQYSNGGANINFDAFLLGILPGLTAMGFPSYQYTQNDISYAVTTKVVQRYGVLKATKVTENSSTLITNNVLWDNETGEVLLTQTQNEFNDNIYNLSLPSYWAYENMGPAYKNIMAQGVINLTGTPSTTVAYDGDNTINLANIFTEGDEVFLYRVGQEMATGRKAWVLSVDRTNSANKVSFINREGGIAYHGLTGTEPFNFKIIRSGRRNQQAIPVGTLVTRKIPTKDTNSDDIADKLSTSIDGENLAALDIINTSAVEYSDHWQIQQRFPSNGNAIETITYYSCQPTGIDEFTSLLNTQLIEHNSYFASTTINTIITNGLVAQNFSSDYSSLDQYDEVDLNIQVLSGSPNVLAVSFAYSDYGCNGHPILIRCLDSGNPFTVSNGYFSSIEYFTAGGALTEDEYNDLVTAYGTGDFGILSATDGTGKCYRFVVYFENEYCEFDIVNSCSEATYKTCDAANDIMTCNGPIVNNSVSQSPNPYQSAIRGIWRPLRSFAYNTERNYTGGYSTTQPNLRIDGMYKDFTPFWLPPASTNAPWTPIDATGTKWVFQQEVTKCSPHGFEVENRDALNRYSGAVYGYFNSLPIITGANAQYKQLAFDGFEDYEFSATLLPGQTGCVVKDHFSYYDVVNINDDLANVAHTGVKSLKVDPDETFVAKRQLTNSAPEPDANDAFMTTYTTQTEDILPLFSPGNGKYILSAWVKANETDLQYTTITVLVVDDATLDETTLVTLYANTTQPKVEGWKKVEGTFTIDENTLPANSSIKVVLGLGTTAAAPVYFDDIRIHPFDSNPKSYVYDAIRLRVVAVLDENNYATFYEYDEQGNLVRVKKETERGIMTIQENHQNIKKTP